MKSVLLYANEDAGLEARLKAGVDLARLFGGRLTCLHVTPYNAFIMSDPFGGVYALPNVVGELARREEAHRARIAARLDEEGISWRWDQVEGGPAEQLVDRARLSDLIVLGLPADGDDDRLSIAGDVALHSRAPVLAVPQQGRAPDWTGKAMVAWNGAPEAAQALRLAAPLLARAAAVEIVTIAEDQTGFPASEASAYLDLHGIAATLHEWPREGRSTGGALIDAAAGLGADYVVMGAYGHSRLRESVLGGATREMLDHSPLPLLLGH